MTYAEFITRLGQLVSFDAENPGSVSVAGLELLISLAEPRIYRELRTSNNEKPWNLTTLSNRITLPDDFKQASVVHFGALPLQPVPYEWLQEYLQSGDNSSTIKYFANTQNYIYFAPAQGDGVAVQGSYYCSFPTLSESNIAANTLLQAAPELFLFACMVEAAPLFGFMDQIQVWEQKYQNVRDALNTENQMNALGAGRIKRRASTTLMG